ncbi:MAG: transketolase [Phycisphaerae bacterium]
MTVLSNAAFQNSDQSGFLSLGETIVTAIATAHTKAAELGKHVIRMTTAAGSGHPSTALAIGHLVYELMYKRMRYDLSDPWNTENDRLVLSVGHAVPMVYAAYADLGGTVGKSKDDAFALKVDHLADLRELESVLDGHPNPAEGFPFFDAATGSLGQGLSVAAGLGLAAKMSGSNRRVYVILGDGESREGQVWEAMDFIADHGLTNVCTIFSCNGHGQASSVSAQQSASVLHSKAESFGFQAVTVDGHDPASLGSALDSFGATDRPLAIMAETVKGWGCDTMLGKNFHGKPVPAAEVETACSELDSFAAALAAAPDDVSRPEVPGASSSSGSAGRISMPAFADTLKTFGQEAVLEKRKLATRAGYGLALAALGGVDDRVIALDADVSNSTYADRFAKHYPDRFVECKIAEQNMVSVAAGMAAAGMIPFASSFAKFIARSVDQIDMAAISRANIKIVGSHAGVSLAADGPSQMAVSDVAYFRSMTRVDNGRGVPLAYMFQPSDAICAYRCVERMANLDALCYMRTHRPEAAFLYDVDTAFDERGFQRLKEGHDLVMVSSGYMLHSVLAAADRLNQEGISTAVFDVFMFPFDRDALLDEAGGAGALRPSVSWASLPLSMVLWLRAFAAV